MGRTASADPIPIIVHDFDDRPAGLQAYNEQDLSLFTYLDGMVATGVEIAASPFATSPPNLVRGFLPGSGVLGRFLATEGPPATLATRLLFLDITGPMDATAPWRLSIFDREGALMESHTGFTAVGMGFTPVNRPGIGSFLFEPGVPTQGLDNVRYEMPAVPEPTTMLLVGSGLAAAAWRGRRRDASGAKG
jgi:hypothetical protein